MKKARKYNRPKSRFSLRNGIVYVWAVVVLLLLIATTGLALDIGKVVIVSQQLQNAADAAALAGARIIKVNRTGAIASAIETALANSVDGQSVQLADSDVIIGRYDMATRTFTETSTAINAVKVVVSRNNSSASGPITLNFGSLFNMDTYDISRYAIAIAAGGTGSGMVSLADDGIGLSINGDISLTIPDGAILVNSSAGNAVRIIGQPELNALELDVVGDVDAGRGFEFDPNFVVNTGIDAKPDPICPDYPDDCLPEPSWDSNYDLSPGPGQTIDISGGTMELEPGYYSGGLHITGGNVTLKPGIYILDGSSKGQKAGLVIGGNANVCAKGVMIYVVGDGVIDIAGNGSIVLSPIQYDNQEFCDSSYSYPPNVDYTFEEVGLYQARDNFNSARIVGTSFLDLNGTLYFPENHLNISGSGDGFGDQLIAKTIEVSGGGDMVIRYDGRNRSPANRGYLVE